MSKLSKFNIFSVLCAIILSLLVWPLDQAQANPNIAVEGAVRATFAHAPDMIAIAKCESGMRQFSANGTLIRGGSSGRYIGIFQIDEILHAAKAKSLGYDIYTVEGNIAYAHYMHAASGTNPWKGCLPGSAAPSSNPTPGADAITAPNITPTPASSTNSPVSSPVVQSVNGSLTVNLNAGMSNPQVMTLQQILNKSGFVITPSGPGSPGQETNYFGALTREAVKQFQCAKQIACSGNESSTGFGRVGPMTRNALNALIK